MTTIHSHADTIGHFPKELYGGLFRDPDWNFLTILALATLVLGSITFFLSIREIKEATSDKAITEIQDRYARFVLDIPVKVVEKAVSGAKKKSTDLDEIKELDEIREIVIAEVPQQKVIPEIPTVRQEVEFFEEEEEFSLNTQTPVLPDTGIALTDRYQARDLSVDISAEAGYDAGFQRSPDLPDIEVGSSSRYSKRMDKRSIDISDSGSKALALPSSGIDQNIAVKSKKRYDVTRRKKREGITAMEILEKKQKAIIVASKTPAPSIERKSRYAGAVRSRPTYVSPVMEERKANKPIIKSSPNIPTVQGALPKRYSGGRKKTYSAVTAERQPGKNTGTAKKSKKIQKLPETAAVQHLTACVDPMKETRLKKKIIAIMDDISYCEDRRGKFGFYNTEMLTTLDVRFASFTDGDYNRCDALSFALQCLSKETSEVQ